jgi:hypothetical protein
MSCRLRLPAVIMALCGLLLACSSPQSAERRPPNARPVAATPDGFAAFFTEECIEQQNAEWVRRQWKAIPCLDECAWIDGDFSWTVPANDGSTIMVEMSWVPRPPGGPPPGLMNCSLSVSTANGARLRQSISRLHLQGIDFSAPPLSRREDYFVWRGAPGGALLRLERYESPEEYDERVATDDRSANSNSNDWYRNLLVRRQEFPWELAVIYD